MPLTILRRASSLSTERAPGTLAADVSYPTAMYSSPMRLPLRGRMWMSESAASWRRGHEYLSWTTMA